MARTMTSAVPLLASEVAVIVVDPFDTGVTRPKASTVAILPLDDDHVNVFPEIVSLLAP